MSEIMTVECFTSNYKDKEWPSGLDGLVGEVSKQNYESALANYRLNRGQEEAMPGKKGSELVKVRFPLGMPSLQPRFYPNDPSVDFQNDAMLLPVNNLRPSKRAALSNFVQKKLTIETKREEVLGVFETSTYFQTASLTTLRNWLQSLHTELPQVWVWYSERRPGEKLPSTFIEARIYGADQLINTYRPGRLLGVAIQIQTRPLLQGYHQRIYTEVLLMTSSREYVGYIDGVAIERCQMTTFKDFLSQSYGQLTLISAAETMARLHQQKTAAKSSSK